LKKMSDASSEFKPFERKEKTTGGHPRPRTGATAKQKAKRDKSAAVRAATVVPAKKK
jgi:hypothetical protein